ncbi:MAG: hydrogen gas-evolving membrane-bound hydrogenase subunit E [Pseudomonadota bacterium]
MAASGQKTPPHTMALGLLLAAVSAGVFVLVAGQLELIAGGAAPSVALPWVPSLGVELAFRLDGLSLIFALLVPGFGAIITLYAGRYLRGHPHLARFYLYLALFMTAMFGVVVADDVILLFVFWELTTVASFLLVGFEHGSKLSRRNAWQALLITGFGGLALLAGLLVLASMADSTRLSDIITTEGLADHRLYPVALGLVLLGAFTKSAQIPFHIWLPGAMAAPTPVSAYLHSATMVKAGVYLLARLHPALSESDAWFWALSTAGSATMIMGAVLSLRQTDLKSALAYTTLLALGALVMFLGASSTVAIAAAMTFIIVHAFYKAALFLVVGAIDHQTGTREIGQLGGLWRRMPLTSIVAVLAAGSMAGFPPFLGFIGKELKYEGALAIAGEPVILAGAAVFANALMVALSLAIILRVVFGRTPEHLSQVREAPFVLWLGPILLALAGLVFGIMPDLLGKFLVQPAVVAVVGEPQVIKLKLWHGVNIPLALSIATVVLGVIVFILYDRICTALGRLPEIAVAAWDTLLDGVTAAFAATTNRFQTGSLRAYLTVTFLAIFAVPMIAVAVMGGIAVPSLDWDVAATGALVLSAAGAIVAASARRRMLALGGLSAIGVGIALIFVIFGAPDVAITQLLVDVLLVVLIATLLVRLPDFKQRRQGKARDTIVAAIAGVSVTVLTLAVTSSGFDSSLADQMSGLSVPEAKGRNIVNVILVDFRALDTFGEIVVVAAAAIGAFALIRQSTRSAPQRSVQS